MATTIERLERIWSEPKGLSFDLATVDHKRIGVRYMVTAFGFFLLAGLMALLMRFQLMAPNLELLSAERFNQFFTMHGTLMIFFFATPMLSGFGNFLVPLMIGARDMAYPRLNAFGYWVFLFSGLFMFSSFFLNAAPNGGWFAYVPLTGPVYSPGVNIDFWAMGLIFLSIATTAGAINFIVTIFKLRAPGMTVSRIPLFVWAILATSFAIMFALPPLTAGNLLLLSDRILETHFYNPQEGGTPLLWQHLFWFFGHPDVYIIFLPAVGIVSAVIPVMVQRPIASYTLVVLATFTIGTIGFGVWVHHMFATGLPQLSYAFFGAASMLIAIPSGVQIFVWITTIWQGVVRWTVPFLYILGFIVLFMIGGVTGVMFAAVPFDWQTTDSYFVVAHFHYVLYGGAVFPIFGGLYYWLPKITGRMLNHRLGVLGFALMFVGFNLTFFPMHIAGLAGMPRRVYTYDEGLGWTAYNVASTAGAVLLGLSILIVIIDVFRSLRHGKPAGNDPWHGDTLEWLTSSPPPEYNFVAIPSVTSREPLWGRWEDEAYLDEPPEEEVRETLGTTVHDADVERTLPMPGESMAPIIVALGLLLISFGVLPDLWPIKIAGIISGVAIVAYGLVLWFWPRPTPESAPEDPPATESLSWWGMGLLIVTEGVLFGSLLTAYLYIRSGVDEWPLGGIEKPTLLLPLIGTALLLGSSLPMFIAESSIKKGNLWGLRAGLLLSFLMGAIFLGIQGYEYATEKFGLSLNAYTSLFFVITGIHGLHVIGGLLLNGWTTGRAFRGHFSATHHESVRNIALYWHFIDVIWTFILATVYLSPHVL